MLHICSALHRARKISTKWQQLGLEVGVGKESSRLTSGSQGVIGEVGDRAAMLDCAYHLPDLGHIAATRATFPRLIHELHMDKEVDVVGNLAVRLFHRENPALCNSGRQTIH